jgi:CheY-like chemotaxis protein
VRELPGQGERPTPAIALTAFPESQHRRRVLEAGFDLYMVKPVDTDLLGREILRLVEADRQTRPVNDPDRKAAS